MTIRFNNNQSDAEPYRGFNYTVKINGTTIGGFTHISGLDMQADVVEYQEGGLHNATHQFPENISHSNVQLHRGVTGHTDFIKWISQTPNMTKEEAQQDVEIAMNDIDGNIARGWKLLRSYPDLTN